MSVNGSYKIFHGRVHVKWEDWNATTGGTLVRPAASTWYDVTIQVQETANASSTTVTNTETPYNADFQVSSVTYSKDGTGAVTANIAFELTTAYPYYASVNGSTPSNYLIHSGTNYAGVTLTGDFTYTATLDGTKKANGQPCAVAGDVCKLSGILSYTWLPTTGSCSLSSEQAYQLDVTLECNSTGINSVCGKPMRDALALPSFGSFQLTGNIDFCKAATTNFPISWPVPFDVAGSSVRTIGAQIVTTGTLEANKKIYGIALKNYRVSRSGLTGEWSLWNAGATNVAYGDAGYDGSLTSVGTATGFVFSQPQSASNGLRWTVSASFTPNIRLFSGPQGFTTTAGQGNFMIVLPDDKGDQLTFRMAIDLRLYTDSMPFARRRLLYRDATIKTAQPAAVNDASASTNPISITVPENLQVSGDGSMTVIKTGALSIGAIAGIAVAGAVVGIAGIGIGLFVLKRKQRKHPPPAMDTEKQEKLRAPTFVMEGVPAWDEVLALPSAAVVFDRAQTPPSVSTLERKRSVLAQEKRETPLTNADKAKMAALMVPASSYIGSLNAQKSGTLPR